MFASTNLLMEPFDCYAPNASQRWRELLKRIEHLFKVTKITTDDEKLSALFLYGGTELNSIHETLPVALPTGNEEIKTEYGKATFRLDAYFNPKKNVMMEQYKFCQTRQERETVAQYVTRLRILAKYCEFHDTDHEIVKQVILGCASGQLRKELLRKIDGLTIKRLLEIGLVNDTLESNVELVEGKASEQDPSINAIHQRQKRPRSSHGNRSCFRCGGNYFQGHADECPALGKSCAKCNKPNHLADGLR
jgi:hypothetical protein